jgi:hypothetical protein
VHLVGFTIEIYYDAARSYKHQSKRVFLIQRSLTSERSLFFLDFHVSTDFRSGKRTFKMHADKDGRRNGPNRGKQKYSEDACYATLRTTNFTRTGLDSNSGLRGYKRLRCSLIIVNIFSPYRAVNTLLGYKNQSTNAV